MAQDPRPDLDRAVDRRRALGMAATAAGAAGAIWLAPSVLSVDAAGAATAPPPPPNGGSIFGFALLCGHEPNPGTFVSYTGPTNGSVPASDIDGSFAINGLPLGVYTLTNGGTSSPPVNVTNGVPVGPITIDDLSGGC